MGVVGQGGAMRMITHADEVAIGGAKARFMVLAWTMADVAPPLFGAYGFGCTPPHAGAPTAPGIGPSSSGRSSPAALAAGFF